MFLRIAIVLFLAINCANAKHLYSEKYYQQTWCKENYGQTEVWMADGTRVDCLTETHAIEFDFAPKWAEAIGQSLHYSRLTGKQAGIVLIIENEADNKYYYRIKSLCEDHQITLWKMKPPAKNAPNKEVFDLEQIIEYILNLIYKLFNILLSYFQ